jgi:phytoene dehydrogenase-like protein
MTDRWDAIVVGGGHNGLVAGFYLARGGLKTLILERREFVGGACVTEEFAPGFRASPGAYVLSMLRPQIWRDMRLRERGLKVSQSGPSLNVFPDGRSFTLHAETREAVEEIARISRKDADAFPRFERHFKEVASRTRRISARPPSPDGWGSATAGRSPRSPTCSRRRRARSSTSSSTPRRRSRRSVGSRSATRSPARRRRARRTGSSTRRRSRAGRAAASAGDLSTAAWAWSRG